MYVKQGGEVRNSSYPVWIRTFFVKKHGNNNAKIIRRQKIRPGILKELVVLKLNQVADRMRARHKIPLVWEDAVIENIAASCTAVDTGARNIDHIINESLLPGLATVLLGLSGQSDSKNRLSVGLDAGGPKFTYTLE